MSTNTEPFPGRAALYEACKRFTAVYPRFGEINITTKLLNQYLTIFVREGDEAGEKFAFESAELLKRATLH